MNTPSRQELEVNIVMLEDQMATMWATGNTAAYQKLLVWFHMVHDQLNPPTQDVVEDTYA